MPVIPNKLKTDFILEALLEVRFHSPVVVPEVIIGRFLDGLEWGLESRRLPTADIPDIVRNASPELRYQPTFELAGKSSNRAVKVGPHVLSLHNVAPYVGWSNFKEMAQELMELLFRRNSGIIIQRVGLRYVNAINPKVHPFMAISDLDVNIKLGDDVLINSFNLNYSRLLERDISVTVRVATPDFVQGSVPPECIGIIDVDVATKDRPRIVNVNEMMLWFERAHGAEKSAFFSLFKDTSVTEMMEK